MRSVSVPPIWPVFVLEAKTPPGVSSNLLTMYTHVFAWRVSLSNMSHIEWWVVDTDTLTVQHIWVSTTPLFSLSLKIHTLWVVKVSKRKKK